ncbi:O-antigen polysaccharide polymerase Wzy [Myroides odoratimimus]|uniref:O-antigen polysaccharide polymerase Wzy n=1 Tax=Myroides odoratimimus TaxID=76832 RepID=UPI003100C201
MYRFYSIILVPIFMITLLLYSLSINNEFSSSLLSITLILVVVCTAIFVLSTFVDPVREIRRQYIRPIYLFLLGYLIVFFQGYLDLLLGYIDEFDKFYFVHPSLINQSALLSLLGLVALFMGYFSYKKKLLRIKVKYKITPLKGLILFFTFLHVLYIYFNISTILYGQYSQALIESQVGSAAAYIELLFYVTYLSIIIIHAINCRLREVVSIKEFVLSLNKLFYINIIIYIFLVMISGDRGPILSIALTYICALTVGTLIRIKFKYILVGVLGGALFLSLLGIVRKLEDNSTMYDKIVYALKEDKLNEKYSSISPSTAELSTSVRTLHYSVESVPSRYPYLYGVFQIRESLKIIPFASGIFDPLFNPHFRYKNSAFYVTWLDKGEFYFVGSGSSINADLYLSFGTLGVFLGLFLVGRLFRKLDTSIFTSDKNFISLFGIVLSVTILGSSIFWSRATLLAPIQPIALTYILVKLYMWNMNRKRT